MLTKGEKPKVSLKEMLQMGKKNFLKLHENRKSKANDSRRKTWRSGSRTLKCSKKSG